MKNKQNRYESQEFSRPKVFKGKGLGSLRKVLKDQNLTLFFSSKIQGEREWDSGQFKGIESEKTVFVKEEYTKNSNFSNMAQGYREKTGRHHWEWWLIVPVLLFFIAKIFD